MIRQMDTYITPFGLHRMVHMYLPDDWQSSGRRYPVLYMFDGHNLFFDNYATYGKCWGLKEYLDRTRTPVIVVGVECNHEGNRRLSEYCPYDVPADWWGGFEGCGKEYMEWLAGEFKPWIDSNYPTLPGRESTLIGGSSMGGLMSLYAAGCYNEVFSRAACLSPSVRLCMDDITADIRNCTLAGETRVYMSWGTEEVRSKMDLAKMTERCLYLGNVLTCKGAAVYPYLHVRGEHNEASWEQEVPLFMDFLLGSQQAPAAGAPAPVSFTGIGPQNEFEEPKPSQLRLILGPDFEQKMTGGKA